MPDLAFSRLVNLIENAADGDGFLQIAIAALTTTQANLSALQDVGEARLSPTGLS